MMKQSRDIITQQTEVSRRSNNPKADLHSYYNSQEKKGKQIKEKRSINLILGES